MKFSAILVAFTLFVALSAAAPCNHDHGCGDKKSINKENNSRVNKENNSRFNKENNSRVNNENNSRTKNENNRNSEDNSRSNDESKKISQNAGNIGNSDFKSSGLLNLPNINLFSPTTNNNKVSQSANIH